MVTARGIVDYLLSLDEGLRHHYNVYQTIVFTVNHRKPKLFQSFIHEKQRGLSAKMDQACSGLSPPSYRPCWAHNKKPKRHSHSGFFDPSTLLVKEPLFLDFELVLLYKKKLFRYFISKS